MAIKLLVRPNPYAAFDHNGNLSGVVAYDAGVHVRYSDPFSGVHEKDRRWEVRRYIGARINAEKTVVPPANGDYLPNGDQETVWDFDTDTEVPLPVTPHYKMLVRTGGLIAANLETAIESGIAEADYLEPAAALEASRQTLIADWKAQYPAAELPDWGKSSPAKAGKAEAHKHSDPNQLKKVSA